MYVRAGGFADVAAHEDVLLATGSGASDGRVVSTAKQPGADQRPHVRTALRPAWPRYLADLAQRSESADVERRVLSGPISQPRCISVLEFAS